MLGIFDDRPKHRGKRGEILPEPHEGLPDSERPCGLCPRCMKQTSFEPLGSIPVTYEKDVYAHEKDGTVTNPHVEQATVLLCRHCRHGVVVVEALYVGGVHHSQSRSGALTWRGFHWWPPPESTLSPDVPSQISSAFDEAQRALAAKCPRAAAVMARRSVEAVADEQGATSGVLAARIAALASTGKLQPTLAEWAREVRLIGNVGAHFDPAQDVTNEDAAQLIAFVRELLKYLYELPAQLNRRRQTP